MLGGLGVVLAAGLVLAFWRPAKVESHREPVAIGMASPLTPAAGVFTNYAGSQSCQSCHQEEYENWQKSNHGLAERLVTAAQDQPAFAPPRKFRHVSQTTEVSPTKGGFQITTLGFQSNVQPYAVERVIGHDPVRQFLTAAPGGRWQVHEATYDPKSNEWFNVYGTDDRLPGEFGHWTGRGMNWNSACAECHNTRFRKQYDRTNDVFHSTMAEMSVGCEACHGPMKDHVTWYQTPPAARRQPAPPARYSPAQMLDTCGSCHALRDNLTDDFQPGDSFYDHYSLATLDIYDRWYPDGQVRAEDYEFTSFLSSRMHAAGVRCNACHEPHTSKLRVAGNLMCLSCHGNLTTNGAPRIDLATHSHHPAGTSGDSCAGCHMPVTTYMQRHPRHDHGFTIPDPLLTQQLGIPNACNRCHADQSTEWALKYTEQWYGGKMQRPTRTRAQTMAAARRGDPAGRDQLLALLQQEPTAYWRAVSVGLLWQWAAEPAVKAAIFAGLKSEHPLVREKAARALEPLMDNLHPEVLQPLRALLEDPVRSVRVAAAWTLRATVDLQSRAGRDLEASLALTAEQPSGQYRRGMLLLARHKPVEALEHLRRAVEWDPLSPPLRHAVADLLGRLNRKEAAVAEWQVACRLEPQSAEAREYLGMALAEAHEFDKAAEAFATGIKLDAQRASAWFHLGLVRDTLGQSAAALEALGQAEKLDARDPNIPFAQASILAKARRLDEARAAAERALAIQPDFIRARELLERLNRRN